MDRKKSILELAEQFKKMEVENALFDFKTKDGVYYWGIFRYGVYMQVLSKFGIYENVNSFLNDKTASYFKSVVRLIKLFNQSALDKLRTVFWLKQPKKYCFLLVSRFEDENGNPIDKLLSDFYKEVEDKSYMLELFRHRKDKWYRKGFRRYYLFDLEILKLLQKKTNEDWEALTSVINENFDIDINWAGYFDKTLREYKATHRYFTRLFRKIKPEILFFQSEPKGMIAAANELGIITADIQHGHTNNVDMMYSFPLHLSYKNITTIPDYLLTLGGFWNTVVDFPKTKLTTGSNYFHTPRLAEIKNEGILIVSSMFVHKYLVEATMYAAVRLPQYIFYYKLHSNQEGQIEDTKNFFKGITNVKVVYTERDITDLLNYCFATALIQSSVSYQALQKGLKVYIFKHDYYEASYDIFDRDDVILVEDYEEFCQKLDTTEIKMKNKPVFYEPFNKEIYREFLKNAKK